MSQQQMNIDAEVIIIGAGIAGLSAYHELKKQGISTLILEKSRGQGGRCATRRGEHFIADHGAQFFSVKSPDWVNLTSRYQSILHPIQVNSNSTHPRYTHPLGLSTLARFFDAKSALKNNEKVIELRHSSEKKCYEIKTESGGLFRGKNILLTAPVPQSLELLVASNFKIKNPEIERKLRAIQYDPCIALIIELRNEIHIGQFGILKNPDSDFAGIYNQAEKGLNTETPVLVVHASPALSQSLWDKEPDHSKAILVSKLENCLKNKGIQFEIRETHLHRWKYSEPKICFDDAYVFLNVPGQELALAGDGFQHSSIEGAFRSGLAAARALSNQGI